jgi:hypothetical protein
MFKQNDTATYIRNGRIKMAGRIMIRGSGREVNDHLTGIRIICCKQIIPSIA